MALIISLAVLLLSVLIGFSARCIFFHQGKRTNGSDALLLTLVGFVGLSLLYCTLGIFKQLRFWPFLCLAIVMALPGALILLKCLRANAGGALLREMRPSTFAVVCFLCVVPAIWIGAFVATLPPFNWDEISYGLTFAKLHISFGDIRYLTNYGIFSAFPMFGETVIGIPYLLYANPTAVHWIVLAFLCISFLLVYELYLQFSTSKLCALLCVVGVAYFPLSLGNIGTAKIEPYQLAYILASVYALLLYRKEQLGGYRYLSYLLIGFAAGIKYTTIFSAPLYLCIYLMTATSKDSGWQHLKEIAKLLLIGVLVNGVWLLNNWFNLCNPLFPNLLGLFGQCLKYPVTKDIMDMVLEATMSQKNTSWATTHSLDNFYTLFVNGFGMLSSLLLAACLVIYALRKSLWKDRFLFWMFVGIVLTLLMQAFAIYWEFRYTYFIFTFMLMFSLLIMERLQPHFLIRTILIGVFAVQAWQSVSIYFQHNPATRLVMTGDIKRAGYEEKFIHLYWVANYLNENTPQDAVIAFNWGVQPFFYLDRQFFFMHDWNPEESLQTAQSADQLFVVLKKKNISYLVWRNQDDSNYLDPSKSKAFRLRMNNFLNALIADGSLIQIYARDDARIFKVKPNENK